MLMSCAINLHNRDFSTYFPFVHCLEANNGHPGAGRECAEQSKMSWSKIKACASSNQGQHWQMQFARKTQQANNDYTPWVVVNGNVVRSESRADNLLGLICSKYQGSADLPSCCSDDTKMAMTSSVGVDTKLNVCWKSPERKEYFLRDHADMADRSEMHDPVATTTDDEDAFDREVDEHDSEEEGELDTLIQESDADDVEQEEEEEEEDVENEEVDNNDE